jgi:hypothetical protein
LCLFFEAKAEDNFEDNFDGAFSLDSQFDQWFALIKFFLFLVPVKKVPFRGHCMMGLELKIDISVAPLILTSTLKRQPIRNMTFYSISKRVKILRRLIEKFSFNKSLV